MPSRQRGLAKILAEPTLTTLTGQEAQFLSGGSFPIPVSQDNGRIGIEFKDFGVKLVFQPLILGGQPHQPEAQRQRERAGRYRTRWCLRRSARRRVFAIPSLTERRAVSTVELSDGQSIGIAGLMNENMRTAVNKFPGLGDMPILGHLFRSQNFQKGQTELVILVTPQAREADQAERDQAADRHHGRSERLRSFSSSARWKAERRPLSRRLRRRGQLIGSNALETR